jgi:peptidoglycan/LPS O-acetylase OafA/YrhL
LCPVTQTGTPPDPTWAVRKRYFPAVEGMRGIAALLVLVGHVLQVSYLPETHRAVFGYWVSVFGVVVFFTISGFLLYRPFLSARANRRSLLSFTPSYLWRRVVRIFPAYWVAITLLAIWPGLEGIFTGRWWAYYALVQVYATVHYGLPVAWTLCVEVSFYVALPIIALVLSTRGVGSDHRHSLRWELLVLIGLAVASTWWRADITTSQSYGFLGLSLLGTFAWFAGGMMLAIAQVAHPSALGRFRRFVSRPELAWPLGAAIFALLPLKVLESGLPTFWVLALQTVVLAIAGLLAMGPATLGDGSRLISILLENRVIVFMGTISYGIYLWHYQVLSWLIHQFWAIELPHHILSIGILTFLGAVALGTASWYLVEQPLMKRARSVKALAHVRKETVEVQPDGSTVHPLVAEEPGNDGQGTESGTENGAEASAERQEAASP